jgi:Alw26I/Eco31I/Esp3I family type II restriction m6 adenine DNA methyltransferase
VTTDSTLLSLSVPLIKLYDSVGDYTAEMPARFYKKGESVDYDKRRKQKDFGAYYTDTHFAELLSSIVIDKKVTPLVDKAIDVSDQSTTNETAERALSLSFCDPTVGTGVFLASITPQLETELWRLSKVIPNDIVAEDFPMLASQNALSKHIFSRMLYGVDRDSRAIAGAAKNIAQESVSPLDDEEIIKCLSPNLKKGDALFNPLDPLSLPNSDTLNFPVRIKQLYRVRQNLLETPGINTAEDALSARNDIVREWSGNLLKELPDWYFTSRQPFCWELEFPEVFYGDDGTLDADGGFDVVIGNPPWDVVKPNDQEFFDQHHPGFSKKSRSKRDEIKGELLENEEIQSQYNRYCEEIDLFLDFVKSDRYYRHQTSGRYGHTYNTYKLATELSYNIAGTDGIVSLITPSGLAGEAGSAGLRRLLFENTEVDSFWSFKARADIFNGIDQKFCTHIYSKGGQTTEFRFADEIESVEEFERVHASADLPKISAELVRESAPETFSLIPAREKLDVSVLEGLYEHPLASSEGAAFTVNPTRELDETKHRDYIISEETKYRFAKGKCVHPLHFDPEIVDKYVDEDLLESESDHYDQSRVVWRDIARPSLRRRMFVTIVPPNCGIGNSLNYVVPEQTEEQKRYIAAVMQSWVFEYRARQISTNSHINMYVVRQIPIPRIDESLPLFDNIVSKVDEILNTEPADRSREEILSEIDALVAHAYDLSESELGHILSRFEKLEEETIKDILTNYRMFTSTPDEVTTND